MGELSSSVWSLSSWRLLLASKQAKRIVLIAQYPLAMNNEENANVGMDRKAYISLLLFE